MIAGVATAVILGLAAIAMLVGFDQLFLTFHMLSFSNDFWRLDPATDRLVRESQHRRGFLKQPYDLLCREHVSKASEHRI